MWALLSRTLTHRKLSQEIWKPNDKSNWINSNRSCGTIFSQFSKRIQVFCCLHIWLQSQNLGILQEEKRWNFHEIKKIQGVNGGKWKYVPCRLTKGVNSCQKNSSYIIIIWYQTTIDLNIDSPTKWGRWMPKLNHCGMDKKLGIWSLAFQVSYGMKL
jgi:hypothetical protein